MTIKVNSKKVKKEGDKYYYLEKKKKIFLDEIESMIKFHGRHKLILICDTYVYVHIHVQVHIYMQFHFHTCTFTFMLTIMWAHGPPLRRIWAPCLEVLWCFCSAIFRFFGLL